MTRQDLADLSAFTTVARERSFTRAAAKLAITPSALSHSMRGLEERLGSVTPTEAGERLLASVSVRFDEIEEEVAALGALRDRPAGTSGSPRTNSRWNSFSGRRCDASCRTIPTSRSKW
jgi:DNA-binding transcriptional LysR family regulator